ncbi:MAG: 50S ribosomal protein L30 [Acidimicrobiia bacterium]
MTKAKAKTVTVTLKRSLIGQKPKTRATVESLGLRKISQSAVHNDNPSLRGMLDKVRHLVDVDES